MFLFNTKVFLTLEVMGQDYIYTYLKITKTLKNKN